MLNNTIGWGGALDLEDTLPPLRQSRALQDLVHYGPSVAFLVDSAESLEVWPLHCMLV